MNHRHCKPVIPYLLVFLLALAAGAGPLSAGDACRPAADRPGAAGPENGNLGGTSWQLVRIMSMDDTEHAPDDALLYTLAFSADGTMTLRADCNRASGSWTSESPGLLQFGTIAATRAMCPPGSLHDIFLAQFEWVRSYVVENGHLFLATMADGSIIEFEPQAALPPAATVLDVEIQTEDAREMQAAILEALFERYKADNGISAGKEEIETFDERLDHVAKKDRAEREARLADIERQLKSADLPPDDREALENERRQTSDLLESLETGEDMTAEEAAEVAVMRREMARAIIEQWKLNRTLYQQYGGRIIYQQLGPEPLDAYRRFLEERQKEGAFTIRDKELAAGFWRYFTDDSIHSFYEPGSEDEAKAFAVPPWVEPLSDAPGE